MGKNMKRRSKVLAILLAIMFAFAGCAAIQLQPQSETISTVSLMGLTWRGQPCSNIMVPIDLPQEFISHADDLIVESHLGGAVVALIFMASDNSWTITGIFTTICPNLIMLTYYEYKTQKDLSYIWNPAGNIKIATDAEWTTMLNAVTTNPAIVKKYCQLWENKDTDIKI